MYINNYQIGGLSSLKTRAGNRAQTSWVGRSKTGTNLDGLERGKDPPGHWIQVVFLTFGRLSF